ncbi:MAG TPA: hypothetical protein VGM78_00960, partial [Ilumatobacteraceae bacterium]
MSEQTGKSPVGASAAGVAAWALRIVWVLQPLALLPELSAATTHLSTAGSAVVAIPAWATWAVVLLATLVPSTVSLTVGRLAAPIAVVVAAAAAVVGDVAGWKAAVAIAASLLATIVWFSGETGGALAQGSAYGDEQRFPLKPPVPVIVPMTVTWLVMAAAAVGGVGLLANGRWIFGAILVLAAAAVAYSTGPRFHLLSRR